MAILDATGTKLEIGGTTGVAVTGLTPEAGNPTIFKATAHGLKNGDIVTIAGVAGTNATNLNKSWVVKYATSIRLPLITIRRATQKWGRRRRQPQQHG